MGCTVRRHVGIAKESSNGRAEALTSMRLPGFKWLTLPGFLIGLVESFLYGAYAGLVYVPVYNFFARRFQPDAS